MRTPPAAIGFDCTPRDALVALSALARTAADAVAVLAQSAVGQEERLREASALLRRAQRQRERVRVRTDRRSWRGASSNDLRFLARDLLGVARAASEVAAWQRADAAARSVDGLIGAARDAARALAHATTVIEHSAGVDAPGFARVHECLSEGRHAARLARSGAIAHGGSPAAVLDRLALLSRLEALIRAEREAAATLARPSVTRS